MKTLKEAFQIFDTIMTATNETLADYTLSEVRNIINEHDCGDYLIFRTD